MWYAPGEDPYKSPEINRQDRFFHDLDQVHEQIARDQARMFESWNRDIKASPAKPAASRPAVGSPARPAQPRRRAQPAMRKPPTKAERWRAVLKLLALCIVVDWLLIAGGAPAWKVVAYTALTAGSFIAAALALAALARAVEAFLRSRTGRLGLLLGGGLALACLFYAA